MSMAMLLNSFVPHQISILNVPNKNRCSNRIFPFCSLRNPILGSSSEVALHAQRLVHQFDPKIPLEKAITPPTSWYTDPSFFELELDRFFYTGWQAVDLDVLNLLYVEMRMGRFMPFTTSAVIMPHFLHLVADRNLALSALTMGGHTD